MTECQVVTGIVATGGYLDLIRVDVACERTPIRRTGHHHHERNTQRKRPADPEHGRAQLGEAHAAGAPRAAQQQPHHHGARNRVIETDQQQQRSGRKQPDQTALAEVQTHCRDPDGAAQPIHDVAGRTDVDQHKDVRRQRLDDPFDDDPWIDRPIRRRHRQPHRVVEQRPDQRQQDQRSAVALDRTIRRSAERDAQSHEDHRRMRKEADDHHEQHIHPHASRAAVPLIFGRLLDNPQQSAVEPRIEQQRHDQRTGSDDPGQHEAVCRKRRRDHHQTDHRPAEDQRYQGHAHGGADGRPGKRRDEDVVHADRGAAGDGRGRLVAGLARGATCAASKTRKLVPTLHAHRRVDRNRRATGRTGRLGARGAGAEFHRRRQGHGLRRGFLFCRGAFVCRGFIDPRFGQGSRIVRQLGHRAARRAFDPLARGVIGCAESPSTRALNGNGHPSGPRSSRYHPYRPVSSNVAIGVQKVNCFPVPPALLQWSFPPTSWLESPYPANGPLELILPPRWVRPAKRDKIRVEGRPSCRNAIPTCR